MKENSYFVVYLNDGYRFDFNEQCNSIDYSNNNVMVFKHYYNDDKNYRALALIPYSNIKHVLSVKKDEEEGE